MAIDCGIDIGSTNLKVVLIDDEGNMVHASTVPSPRVHDGIGPVTDAAALVSLLEDMIIEGWRRNGRGEALRSITTAGVGEDGLGLRPDLSPAGPSIPWFDRRAEGELPQLHRLGDVTDRTGISIAADRTIAKWAWLRRHRPHELDGAAYWVALTDYPAVAWTGCPFMSISLAPRTACFDVLSRQWVAQLLDAVGAPRLPAIMSAGMPVGAVRRGRLRESGAASARTVVAAGGHDHPIAASVFRRIEADGFVDSLGTANLLYGEIAAASCVARHSDLAISIPPGGGPQLACLGVLELGAVLSPAQRQGSAFWSFLAHPTLPGEPPRAAEDLGEVGVCPRAIRRNLERAAFGARLRIDAMREAGVPKGKIYTSGGWARSRSFIELRASIFGQPVHAVDDREMTAAGAALFGAEAAGAMGVVPLRAADIKVIDPVPAWVPAYDRVFSLISGNAIAGFLS